MEKVEFQSQPVSLLASIRAGRPVPMKDVDPEQAEEDRQAVLRVMPDLDHFKSYNMDKIMPGSHFYVHRPHLEHIQQLHQALDKAVTDIVERWYSDEKAGFPSRMPLRANEDRYLRWVYGPGSHVVPAFKERKGNWRPDYLMEKTTLPNGRVTENPRVCEINARLPWNALIAIPHIAQGFESLGIEKGGLKPAMPLSSIADLLNQFDSSKPLHFVNEKFPVKDPHWVADLFSEKTGQKTRFIKPSDLKWLPDESSDNEYGVFCATEDGSGVERVEQVDFELTQEEYAEIDFETLCRLAPHCVNDPRSVFLVNDQRILGVVYEELEDLVARKTITQQQSEILRQGLAPSFLPTSSIWTKVIEDSKTDPNTKDKWVLKYARAGVSQGHVFGRVVDNDEWLQKLVESQESNSTPDQGSYVLQEYIDQVEYEVWHHLRQEMMHCHEVSSWFACNGKFLGLGGVRMAELTVLNLFTGEGVPMIAITQV